MNGDIAKVHGNAGAHQRVGLVADVEVQVLLPEVEGVRAAASSGVLPVNVSLPPVLRDHSAFARGQLYRFATTVVIPEAGYYRVTVSARKRSSEPPVRERWVQDVAYVEGWLLVIEKGGRFTPEFDPAAALLRGGTRLRLI